MTNNNRATLRRQMKCVIHDYQRTLDGIIDRYEVAPMYLEDARKALNVYEAGMANTLNYAGFITVCNTAGDAILRHANGIIEAKKRQVAS